MPVKLCPTCAKEFSLAFQGRCTCGHCFRAATIARKEARLKKREEVKGKVVLVETLDAIHGHMARLKSDGVHAVLVTYKRFPKKSVLHVRTNTSTIQDVTAKLNLKAILSKAMAKAEMNTGNSVVVQVLGSDGEGTGSLTSLQETNTGNSAVVQVLGSDGEGTGSLTSLQETNTGNSAVVQVLGSDGKGTGSLTSLQEMNTGNSVVVQVLGSDGEGTGSLTSLQEEGTTLILPELPKDCHVMDLKITHGDHSEPTKNSENSPKKRGNKRVKFRKEEEEILLKFFPSARVSHADVKNLMQEHPAFKSRTEVQIRSKIRHLHKSRKA